MAAVLNGIAYHNSGLIPYGGTFLVFADRGAPCASQPSASCASMCSPTTPSVWVKTVRPTSRLRPSSSLRAIPNMLVFRPGDGNETSGAYKLAIENRHRPSALCLSRQGMYNQANSSIEKVAHGILEDCDGTPELILIGTGTELDLAFKLPSSSPRARKCVWCPCPA